MRTIRGVLLGAGLLLMMAQVAPAAVGCSATGTVEAMGDDAWTYYVTVTWNFHDAAVPDHFNLSLEYLDDCPHYQPGNPEQEGFIITRRGYSTAVPGCIDEDDHPQRSIYWESRLLYENPDCWLPSRHITWINDGLTQDCTPITEDTGLFRFVSRSAPMGPDMFWDAIVIKASDGTCVVCDYFGPLPGCNDWVPVEDSTWGTVKALYR